ncbi:50S ribosomal protein L7/L12 (P1/P2) [Candidatus Nasuia deltocephalinicola]|nr:50S ribosomal protein L7/L12 (P1/P2) [Candidatus Nasuia deltocephalinicola]
MNHFKNFNKSIMNTSEILNLIENLTLLELNELIKSFEEKYNTNILSSNNLVKNKEIVKEKTSYSLSLLSVGSNKISIIKIIREISNLGLKESKDLVERAPTLIKDNIDLVTANLLKKKFEDAGSIVEIK